MKYSQEHLENVYLEGGIEALDHLNPNSPKDEAAIDVLKLKLQAVDEILVALPNPDRSTSREVAVMNAVNAPRPRKLMWLYGGGLGTVLAAAMVMLFVNTQNKIEEFAPMIQASEPVYAEKRAAKDEVAERRVDIKKMRSNAKPAPAAAAKVAKAKNQEDASLALSPADDEADDRDVSDTFAESEIAASETFVKLPVGGINDAMGGLKGVSEGVGGLGSRGVGAGAGGMSAGAGGYGSGVGYAGAKADFAPRRRVSKKKIMLAPPPAAPMDRAGQEDYAEINEKGFIRVSQDPRSTFSIDVDTGSYSNVRRMINQGRAPSRNAVRLEEMVNYFKYSYPGPRGDKPFSVNTEVVGAPWAEGHRLVRVGLKGKELERSKRPATNLVFLLDVSGSMSDTSKLPLLKKAMEMLTESMRAQDRVSIVTYAGSAGLVLAPTPGNAQRKIMKAMDRLSAGGSTNGGAGIQLAYETARKVFIKGGVNRVMLATDGDFNVGLRSKSDLYTLIKSEAKSGIFLTTMGFGYGNLKDDTLEQLADKGNGQYAYIDTISEARKFLVDDMMGTLVTIAKDVKIQVEFNPATVEGYRLLGYENRRLAHQDFNDDSKDAGEIGVGHTVTALYEIVPKGMSVPSPGVDALKYQSPTMSMNSAAKNGELMTIKLRYKKPDGDTSQKIEHSVKDSGKSFAQGSTDTRFAGAVALFAMGLRDSAYRGIQNKINLMRQVVEIAQSSKGRDIHGRRGAFVALVNKSIASQKGVGTGGLIDEPVIEGALSTSDVKQAFEPVRNQLRYCYEQELGRSPKLAGKVVVLMTIEKSGRVTETSLQASTLKNRSMERCILNVVRRIQFASKAGKTSLRYPLNFAPN